MMIVFAVENTNVKKKLFTVRSEDATNFQQGSAETRLVEIRFRGN